MTIGEMDRVHGVADKIGTTVQATSHGMEWLPILERMAFIVEDQERQIHDLKMEVRRGGNSRFSVTEIEA